MSDEDEKSGSPKEKLPGPPVNIVVETKHPDDDAKVMHCCHILEEILLNARKGAYRDLVIVAERRTPEGVGLQVRHTNLSNEWQMIGMLESAKDAVKATITKAKK